MRSTSLSPRLRPLLLAAPFVLLAPSASAWDAASTDLVSRSSGGALGNGPSGVGPGRPIAVTEDGRFIAFTSSASNLVPGDTNGATDVFLRDRDLGTTVRCSVGDSGQQGDGNCEMVAVSEDGRFVAYGSRSSNLVPGDSNGTLDVFLWDATTGTSALVSRAPGGSPGNGESTWPSVDGTGGRVVFQSLASDLVASDANNQRDCFVYDVSTGLVDIVSLGPSDEPGTGPSVTPTISRDGRFVAFASGSTWDPLDPNGVTDIYVRDLVLRTTELVGGQSGGYGLDLAEPSISSGGRYVAFHSRSASIPGGSTNGRWSVYRFDRQQDSFELISRSTAGTSAAADCFIGGMSVDGAWISFTTRDANIVPSTTSAVVRCYVRRVDQEWTELISVGETGQILDQVSEEPVVAGDGRFVCFRTADPDGAIGDGNLVQDVLIRDRGFGTRSAGGTYCVSTPNSSGVPAELSVFGTNKLVDQQLILRAEFLPAGSLGYFLFSETPGDVLGFGNGQGRLCLGGQIFRLSNFIQSSGTGGEVTLPLPFAQLPPAATLSVGDTWNFQYWFRDAVAGQATSNTSSAVCVPLY
ncbi:MAG: hypothetical protein AAF726_12705 [Planctomycetota bacterium]